MAIEIAAEVCIITMNRLEAEQKTERIRQNFNENRRLIKEMHDREGWRALEYRSFEHWATEELGDSYGHVYRQLRAANVESHINEDFCPSGQKQPLIRIPESQLRPMGELLPSDDASDEERREAREKIREAWDLANERTNGKPTGAAVREAVDAVLGREEVKAQPSRSKADDDGSRAAWRELMEGQIRLMGSIQEKRALRALVRGWTPEQKEEFAEELSRMIEGLRLVRDELRKRG